MNVRVWIHETLERRVPQVLGLYLGASWGVIQFVQWAIQRYGLAPDLDHVAFVTCLSLVPSILILTWYHGKADDRGEWTKMEKFGIPANLVFTGALLLLTVRGTDADAATRTVTLTDEEGQRVEKVVPKTEYRKALVVFSLENLSGDAELDWLEDGLPTAVAFDLVQDFFVEAITSTYSGNFAAELRRKGFPGGSGMPLALQREVVEDLHVDSFTAGSFSRRDGEIVVHLTLFDTATGKPIAEHEAVAASPFALADDLSVRLKRDLGIPEEEIAKATDLPVSELLTTSPEAYELLIRGVRSAWFEQQTEEGLELVRRAIERDETFAMAHFIRSNMCLANNDSECAVTSIEAAMRYAYRLPETLRFNVKSLYFLHKGDQEKRVALMKMRAEMFPDDEQAHMALASIHARNRRWSEAIAEFERAFEVSTDPDSLLITLGRAHLQNGNQEKARQYLETYAQRYPDEQRSYTELGYFYQRIADYESAREQYEKGLLLEPDSLALALDLGGVERALGDDAKARERYEEVLATATEAQDRMQALARLETFYRSRGQLAKALEYMERRLEEGVVVNRTTYLLQWLVHVHHYVAVGQVDKARERLEAFRRELEPPFDRLAVIGDLLVDTELGNADAAEARLGELDRLMEDLGDVLTGIPEFRESAAGQIQELRSNFEAALTYYRKGLELDPAETEILIDVLRCQRRLGRLEAAAETRAELLKARPYDPAAHHEAALVYAEAGERQKASEHLERALEIWAEADPGFEPAQEARLKLEELARGSVPNSQSPE